MSGRRPPAVRGVRATGNRAVAEQRVLALGARRLPGAGDDFRVYADPVGHPFCLVWE
ncbi:VOC family protein [Micromonospora sp. CPCC 206060]|uniref:VOC family protein n=1 Tax=Micromonospora sp. CPCC 206060 TaxID=3122406 RepID=UPI002FF1FF3A